MSRILVTEAVIGHIMYRLRKEVDLDVVFEPDIWNDSAALTAAVQDTEAIIICNQTQATAELIAGALKIKSRGEVVVEVALMNAPERCVIAGAGLDLRATEPPVEGDVIVNSNQVVLTPHIAAFPHEARERVVESVCPDVSGVLRGGAAEGYFNFPQPKR